MPPSRRPCLKCGRRDHDTKDCPDKDRAASANHFLQHMQFGATCLGNQNAKKGGDVDAEALNLEKIVAGKALLDCGASDSLGGVEAIEAAIDRSHKMYGEDEECVSVDTTDRPTYKFGNANKQHVLSKVTVRVKPGGDKNLVTSTCTRTTQRVYLFSYRQRHCGRLAQSSTSPQARP